MPTLPGIASWNTCRVYATWVNYDGSNKAGTYEVRIPHEVRNATNDVIIPAGVFASGDLGVTLGNPSLDVQVPANDDPDNTPVAWGQAVVTIKFKDASAGEKYTIDTPADGEVNLRTVIDPENVPAQKPFLVRGVPGGIAGLDGNGQVIDAYGNPVTGGGASLPSQTGNSGKFLTTNGTTTSWGTVTTGGAVDSVNGKTGSVTLSASDVGALPASTSIPSKTSQLTNDSGYLTSATLPINVRDKGAVGDGTTDDTAAIQAALSAVPAGGALVYFPPGAYLITSTLKVTKDGTTIAGAGIGQVKGASQSATGTTLRAAPTLTGPVLAVRKSDTATSPLYGVTLRGLTIDGDLQGTGVNGIEFQANRSLIDHVHVRRCTGDGIIINGYSGFGSYDTLVTNTTSGSNIGAGINLAAYAADCNLIGCIAFNNGDNVIIRSASQQLVSCHLYAATRHNLFFDGSGSRTKVANTKVEGSGQHGICIDTTNGGMSDMQIVGCEFADNGKATSNTYDHVIITGPSSTAASNTLLVGNVFASKTSGVTRYGVNISGSCAHGTVVVSNSFSGSFGTAKLNDANASAYPSEIRVNPGLGVGITAADVGAQPRIPSGTTLPSTATEGDLFILVAS